MIEPETGLTFRSNFVWPWGLVFSEFAELLSGEIPSLQKVNVEFVLGDFFTPPAVADRKADIGMVTPAATLTMAYRGVGPYSRKCENLRAIGALPHDDRMMWAVPADSPIRSIPDMKDHPMRIVMPSGNFPVRFAVDRILEHYGMSVEDLKRRGWEVIEESHCLKIPTFVLRGKADALIHEGRNTPAWLELGKTRPMRYLPMEEAILRKLENPYGYNRGVLHKGMFLGIERDIPCVDFSDWLLFTREDLDEELVYLLTKSMIERKDFLFEFHFRGIPTNLSNLTCPIDVHNVCRNVGKVPLHRGAERYYREKGYL